MSDEYDFSSVLKLMCENDEVRRELLFLNARGRDDEETMRDLEACQPGLADKVAQLVNEFSARGYRFDTPGERRRAFDRLYEERFEHHAQSLSVDARLPGAASRQAGAHVR